MHARIQDSRLFLVMELCVGGNLAEHIYLKDAVIPHRQKLKVVYDRLCLYLCLHARRVVRD